MATLLAKSGVDVIVLEANEDCAQDLRASTFHPPTLEMLDEVDVTPMLLERGLKAPVYNWRDRRSGEVIDFDLSEISDVTRYPFRIQCEQYHLSRALAEGLARYSNAQVRFNHRLLSFEQDDTGVQVFVETPTAIQRIRCDYLIAADGANSVVRKWLGIEFDGFTYPERFLCLSTDEDLTKYLDNLAYVNYVSDPEEWLVLLRVPSVWRVLLPTDGSVSDDELRSDERKNAIFERLIGHGADVKTFHRTLYRVHQRVAKSFLEGRVMLIGDAAHTIHPLAGQGVNLGFLDAAVLAEVLLHAAMRGENLSEERVLSRYERRRMPHNLAMMAAMEGFQRLFQADPLPLRLLRNVGLDLVDGQAEAKALFVRQALGLAGDLPELARA